VYTVYFNLVEESAASLVAYLNSIMAWFCSLDMLEFLCFKKPSNSVFLMDRLDLMALLEEFSKFRF
jgi:hypothetical protein